VFDVGHNAAADEMKTSWEKLTQYVGTTYGQDISNELSNKLTVIPAEPVYPSSATVRHTKRVNNVTATQDKMKTLRLRKLAIAEQAVKDAEAAADPTEIIEAEETVMNLESEIAELEFQKDQGVPFELTPQEQTLYHNEWRTYRERTAKLATHRGQVFSLILGQCTQLLQDKLKQDTDWTTVSTSYNPLTLYRLIEKTTLAQTEDQYPFATVYDQEQAFYAFRQDTLSNAQWYERFNTKVDVGAAIGVTRQHKVLLEYVAMELHNRDFATLGDAEQQAVREDAEERYISYAFLRQSGTQHGNLKVDLQNDFTTGDNRYPKNRQQTLHLLDKYTKTVVSKTTPSEGTSFAQKGGKGKEGGSGKTKRGGKGRKPFNKELWKDKECYKCHKKGHPASHCDDDEDNQSRASQASVNKRISKDIKSIKKAFTQLAKVKETDSSLSGSKTLEEDSHFMIGSHAFQFTQIERELESRIARLSKQAHGARLQRKRNDVSGNKKSFTKRQIKGAEVARTLYAKLGYPSWKDFRWMISSNQIKDCPVTVQDVDVALKIWGKNIAEENIAALKGKTTWRESNNVARDYAKVPSEDGYAAANEDGYAAASEDGYAAASEDGYTAASEVGYEAAPKDGHAAAKEDDHGVAPEVGKAAANADGHGAARAKKDVGLEPESFKMEDKSFANDTVVARVDTFGRDQPEQHIFPDRHVRPIGDVKLPGVDFDEEFNGDGMNIPGVDHVELPGVDSADTQEETVPQPVEIHDDLDIPADDPPPVEAETVEQPENPAAPVEPVPVAEPTQSPGVRRSSRIGPRRRHTARA
jgi:hypothetical protein